ncbi:unnamed protein product [Musa banksii]
MLMAEEIYEEPSGGYKFTPTDRILIVEYLHKKANDAPVPLDLIPEADVYAREPWWLSYEFEYAAEKGEFYYFTRMKRSNASNGRLSRIVGGFGHWRASIERKSVTDEEGRVIGTRMGFKFFVDVIDRQSNKKRTTGTKWVMYEYRLSGHLAHTRVDKEVILCHFKPSGRGIFSIGRQPTHQYELSSGWQSEEAYADTTHGVNPSCDTMIKAEEAGGFAAASLAATPLGQQAGYEHDPTPVQQSLLPLSAAVPPHARYEFDDLLESIVDNTSKPNVSGPVMQTATAACYDRRRPLSSAQGWLAQNPLVEGNSTPYHEDSPRKNLTGSSNSGWTLQQSGQSQFSWVEDSRHCFRSRRIAEWSQVHFANPSETSYNNGQPVLTRSSNKQGSPEPTVFNDDSGT